LASVVRVGDGVDGEPGWALTGAACTGL
jgi:hypothetical protein